MGGSVWAGSANKTGCSAQYVNPLRVRALKRELLYGNRRAIVPRRRL
jgi:hypothetical protein